MDDISQILEYAEKDRRSLLTVNLVKVIENSFADFDDMIGFEASGMLLTLSFLVKLKSELLLLLFSLESFAKRNPSKLLEDDPEVIEIFSVLKKSFDSKKIERSSYVETDSLDEIPFARLSRVVKEILEREKYFEHRTIEKNDISITEVIAKLKDLLTEEETVSFEALLESLSTRIEIVVTFLAVLVLAKNKFLVVRQDDPFAPIYLKRNEEGRVSVSN
ncbi:MAG: segregation/condensation protein A [Caldisericaceae bacterium]